MPRKTHPQVCPEPLKSQQKKKPEGHPPLPLSQTQCRSNCSAFAVLGGVSSSPRATAPTNPAVLSQWRRNTWVTLDIIPPLWIRKSVASRTCRSANRRESPVTSSTQRRTHGPVAPRNFSALAACQCSRKSDKMFRGLVRNESPSQVQRAAASRPGGTLEVND